jgi:hypothetical protein
MVDTVETYDALYRSRSDSSSTTSRSLTVHAAAPFFDDSFFQLIVTGGFLMNSSENNLSLPSDSIITSMAPRSALFWASASVAPRPVASAK